MIQLVCTVPYLAVEEATRSLTVIAVRIGGEHEQMELRFLATCGEKGVMRIGENHCCDRIRDEIKFSNRLWGLW